MDKFAFLEKHQLHFIRSLIFRFYAFDLERLAKLDIEDIDFISLALNTQVKWTDEYIEHFKENIYWRYFVCNEHIIWDKKRVERFEEYIVNKKWLYSNPNYVVDESMLKTGKILFRERNYHLSDELKEKYKHLFFIGSFKRNISYVEDPSIIYTEVAEHLSGNSLLSDEHRKNIYDEVIIPNFKERNIYTYLKQEKKILKLEPIIYSFNSGMIDGYRNTNYMGGVSPSNFNEKDLTCNPAPKIWPIDKVTSKHILLPFSRIKLSGTMHPSYLISQSIKDDLEQLKLSKHGITKVDISHDKIDIDEDYYLLIFEKEHRYEQLDFSNSEWYAKGSRRNILKKIDEYKKFKQDIKNINSIQNLMILESEQMLNNNRFEVILSIYNLKKQNIDYDIFYLHNGLKTNEYLKEFFLKKYGKQFSFYPEAYYQIPEEYFDFKNRDYDFILPANGEEIPFKTPNLSAKDIFYREKINRLEKGKVPPHKVRSGDEFEAKEIELNVLFPPDFKAFYRGKISTKNNLGTGFSFDSIRLFSIYTDYKLEYPAIYNSIIVGGNGAGDSLHLILKKDSDFELEYSLVSVFHETGEPSFW